MTLVWEKLKKGFVDSLNNAIEKTEELTSVGRIKLEILQIEHRLDEKFATLGQHIYENYSDNVDGFLEDAKIAELRKDIQNLETKLGNKEKELGRIKEEEGVDFDS